MYMKPLYSKYKGHSGTIYLYIGCGNCKVLLTTAEENLPKYCPNCGVKIDKN